MEIVESLSTVRIYSTTVSTNTKGRWKEKLFQKDHRTQQEEIRCKISYMMVVECRGWQGTKLRLRRGTRIMIYTDLGSSEVAIQSRMLQVRSAEYVRIREKKQSFVKIGAHEVPIWLRGWGDHSERTVEASSIYRVWTR